MRDFHCPVCGQRLIFENSLCLSCNSNLGFDLSSRQLLPVGDHVMCANLHVARCNWLTTPDEPLCASCRLTITRPADSDTDAIEAFADAEQAKRRLVLELTELGLSIVDREADPAWGLGFDLLSSATEKVTTGHFNGVITLDLAEGDDVHREQMRVEMAEPYRTLLGHFRHEIGHYYFGVLIYGPDRQNRFFELFGDANEDYQAALDRHYQQGPPADWDSTFVSAYASMHAAEDWAETFAHYLHIRDTLDTASAFGFSPSGITLGRRDVTIGEIISQWIPLVWGLNQVNRSMGHPDLYPFVLAEPVVEKLGFVHEVIRNST
ncbi:MAG: putative zinc-binding metallopeptidase [Nocardiaceae bacterium]|nr:putative zinc-binding metallopeptidase [Nocardiaceae bacterium]